MSLKGNVTSKQQLHGKLEIKHGVDGMSAYEVAVANGFEGTEEEWLASLKGKQGEVSIAYADSKYSPSIEEKASGEVVTTTDSAKAKPKNIKLFGKGKQRQYEGKNSLPNNATSKTENDVTFTVNADKSITIKGTPTAETYLYLVTTTDMRTLQKGKYVFSGGKDNAFLTMYKRNWTQIAMSKDNTDVDIELLEDTEYFCYLTVRKDVYYDTTIYPMNRLKGTNNTYEPFVGNEPSPNMKYPQKAEFLGESGSIECGLGADNYAVSNSDYSTEERGILKTKYNGKAKIRLQGIINEEAYPITMEISGRWGVANESAKLFPAGTKMYAFPSNCCFDLYDWHNEKSIYFKGETTLETDFYLDEIFVRFESGYFPNGSIDKTVEFMLTDSLQPFTALTPNGLLGLPVYSGGNYVDSNGQQYLSNYKDYALGKNIEQVQGIRLTSQQAWWYEQGQTNGTHNFQLNLVLAGYGKGSLTYHYVIATASTHFRYLGVDWDNVEKSKIYVWMHTMTVSFSADSEMDSLDKWKQFLDENEVYAYYILEEPIITDLTQEEIDQYNALVMNYPNTTVINDAGAYMEVEYVADTKCYVDNKFKELEANITSAIAQLL